MSEDEAAREWRAAHERVCALVEDAGDEALSRPVPACPDWSGRELLAHMVGVGADSLDGDEPDDHNEDWTQAQVDTRAGRSVTALLAEWRDLAPTLEAYVRDTDPRPMGDAIIHEQDLRGALGAPGARDTVGLATVRDTMSGRLAERVADRPAVRLEADDDPWTWQSHDGDPGLVLRAPLWDLTRTLTCRRTAAQLRAWTIDGDVGPYLEALAFLGPLPEQELPE